MLDKPAAGQILATVRQALEAGIAPGFPQKVVANALGIAEREIAQGSRIEREECARLARLLPAEGPLALRNEALCAALRSGRIALDDSAVCEHLILTAIAKIGVDQPGYPGSAPGKRGHDRCSHAFPPQPVDLRLYSRFLGNARECD